MTPLNDSIVAVLLTVLRQEETMRICHHTNEHLWKRKGYCKIAKKLDKLVHKSRCRIRTILDRVLEFDALPKIDPEEIQCYPTLSELLDYNVGYYRTLNASYEDAIGVCSQFEDSVTEDILNDNQKQVQKILAKWEGIQRQVAEVGGESVYLSLMA